ncbi:MAG: dTMP kinase [Anaerolineales bacterium]|nr:dTMP kinase [Anaerolineales bacterium]
MFITFEGPDGSGKSTQAQRLVAYLRQQGYPVLLTREPGGTPIGEQVRLILNNLENTAMHPRTEILLFQSARAQHVEELIKPHLDQGALVVCDRYADSTLAYQGYGHQLDLIRLRQVVEYATGGLKPDLTLLLDVDAEVGLKRRAGGGDWNRLDAYELAFHKRVREGYSHLVKEDPQRWVVFDGNQPPDVVQAQVRQVVMARIIKMHVK